MKVCSAHGAGFFFIPGTDTCLKIGGRVRVDYDMRGQSATGVGDQRSGFYNRNNLTFDARTPTAFGTVQTFARMRMQAGSGTMQQENTRVASLEAAYVRFAGFTFGQANQPFAFMSSWSTQSSYWTGWPNGVKQLSYTHVLGGGLSASVAVTDGTDYAAGTVGDNATTAKDWKNHPVYVGSLRYDQSWGSLQLMGAYAAEDNNNRVMVPDAGWAIGAGAAFKLPMLARGSEVQFTAVMWDGLAQLGMGTANLRTPSGGSYGPVNPLSANINTLGSDGWSVGGQLRHFWVPQWRSQVYAAYGNMNIVNQANGVKNGEATAWSLGKGLIWSPVRNFDIGVEVQYLRAKSENLAGVQQANDANWVSRLRVERTF